MNMHGEKSLILPGKAVINASDPTFITFSYWLFPGGMIS